MTRRIGVAAVVASLCACSQPRNVSDPPVAAADAAIDEPPPLPPPPDGAPAPAPDLGREAAVVDAAPVDSAVAPDAAADLSPPQALPCAPGQCRPSAIAARFYGTCAIIAEGRVACWGAGPVRTGEPFITRPRLVPGLSRALQIGIGTAFACARVEGGAVKCWGQNTAGQLGDGTTNEAIEPTAVLGLPAVHSLAVGSRHACAQAGADVFCWGDNEEGQVGDPSGTPVLRPARVVLPFGASAVAAGRAHSCALMNENVYCWGGNQEGQLTATMTPAKSAVAVAVIAARPALDIVAGGTHTCVITDVGGAPGGVRCWGANPHGQSAPTSQMRYVGVTDIAVAAPFRLGLGELHTCVLAAGDVARCWGDNRFGQIGNGESGARMLDANVRLTGPAAGASFTAIAAGAYHTCAVGAGRVFCWGQNDRGQLGNGTSIDATAPTPVPDL